MSTDDVNVVMLINKCAKLMASDTNQLSLFSEDFINKLKNIPYLFLFKVYLLPFNTWFDHSILRVLIESSKSKEAIELLNQFDCCIDYDQPIALYNIPEYSQLVIPCKGNKNEFTLLVTIFFKNNNEILLRDLLNIKKAMMLKWELTIHAIHLVAINLELNYFYWMIPKQIQPLIKAKLNQNHHLCVDKGIVMITLLPDNYFCDENLRQNVGSKFNFMNFDEHEDVTMVRLYMGMYVCAYAFYTIYTTIYLQIHIY